MKLDKIAFNKFTGHCGSVVYWLFRSEEPIDGSIHMPVIEGIKHKSPQTNTACFASLNYELNKKWRNNKYNRICYQLEDFNSNCKVFTLTDADRELFLTQCKKNGLLPDYIPIAKVIKRKEIVLALDKHTKNQIYIYLSCFRFLRAEVGFLGAVVTLLKKGWHIYPAILLASKISLGNSNHHFLPPADCVGYIKPPDYDVNDEEVRLCTLIGLHRLTHSSKGQNMLDIAKNELINSGFTCNSTIENSTKLQEKLTVPMMAHPMIGTLASIDTDEQATMFLNVIKKSG